MKFSELSGLDIILEGATTFFIALFGLVVVGSFFVDPTGDLPDLYSKIIKEPLSFLLPFYLALIGVLVAAFSTKFGSTEFPACPFLEWISKAATRAGIAGLAISSGAVLGFSSALWLWSGAYPALLSPAIQGVTSAFVLALIMASIVIFQGINLSSSGVSARRVRLWIVVYGLSAVFLSFVSVIAEGRASLRITIIPIYLLMFMAFYAYARKRGH